MGLTEIPPEEDEEGYQTTIQGHIPLLKDILRDGLSFGFLRRDDNKGENISFEVNLRPGHIKEQLEKLVANVKAMRHNDKE